MPESLRPNFILMFIITVSLFGSFITLMLALHPPTTPENFLWRKPLVGSMFTLICISGIVAGFFPKKCSETFNLRKTEKTAISKIKNPNSHKVSITLKGHHPNCGNFSAHVIQVYGHVLCAACTGLLLGAFIALAGTALYFFAGWDIGQVGFLTVLVGQTGVLLGFIQFKFKGFTRLTLNAFFVFSTFLTLVGIDKLAENTVIELYLIVLIIFWLLTRILISQWDHWRICHECKLFCELKEKQEG